MSNTALLGSYGGQGNSSLMFRNKVINGAMEICQRYAVNTNVTLGAPAYVVDRFVAREATPASANAQWSTVAPDGFANSLAYLITATGTPTTNDIAGIEHKIEGLNVVDLAWGTAAAKPVALSFWARSSVTGTYGGLVTNGAETRAYGYTYSISAANTWEYKTVVIPGDTSGTWLKDNGIGLRITWDMGSGSGKRVAGGSWSTISNFEFGVNSTVILGQTASASFYITGVQLEAETATPFERRPIGTELALCQRYYWRESAGASSAYKAVVMPLTTTRVLGAPFCLPVSLRNSSNVGLTVAHSGVVLYNYALNSAVNVTNIVAFSGGANGTNITLDMTCNALGGTSQPYLLALSGGTGFIAISAEL